MLALLLCVLTTGTHAQEHQQTTTTSRIYLPLTLVFTADINDPAGPDQITGLSVDTSDRDAVQQFFTDHYQSYQNLDHYALADWTGSIDTCDPGTTSAEFRNHTLHRVNFFRALAGVPADVILNDEYNRKAQAAALMMSANGRLSHTPSPDWQCYTADGSDGAFASNLFRGRGGIFAIDGHIEDAGANNKAVEHRWWFLSPYLGQMGAGDALPTGGTIASAHYVVDSSNTDPAMPREYVAWPPPGFVPYQVVYTRWSFTLFSDQPFTEDMTNAVVTMTENGQPVPVEVIYDGSGTFNNHLVWVPLGRDTEQSDAPWPRPAADTTYTVTIQNVLVDGSPRTYTYDVTVFDPNA
jgi:hypothetical protein